MTTLDARQAAARALTWVEAAYGLAGPEFALSPRIRAASRAGYLIQIDVAAGAFVLLEVTRDGAVAVVLDRIADRSRVA